MAPGSGKRKREHQNRGYSQDDGAGRPAPHRPQDLNLAQQNQHQSSRGGRGGGSSRRPSRQGPPQSPIGGVNAVPVTPRNQDAQQRNTPAVESRPSTPAPRVAIPTPAPPTEPEAPRAPPAPYVYEYLSGDAIGSWQETGRQQTLEMLRQQDAMAGVVQELVRSSLDARLDPTEAGSAIREIIQEQQHDGMLDARDAVIDTISVLDEADTKNHALLTFLAATDIDPVILRQDLDTSLLQTLALVRSTFERLKNRRTTNVLYRQANYNLLREETEGFAKLMTDYFQTAQGARGSVTDPKVPKAAFQRIMALIGAFDLDPGRVLDVTLDISANLLVQAYQFFVQFYRCSSWWPEPGVLDNIKWQESGFDPLPRWAISGSDLSQSSDDGMADTNSVREARDVRFWERVRDEGIQAYFEIGTRKILGYDSILPILETEMQPEIDNKGQEPSKNKRSRTNENRRYMKETQTLPPQGNPEAAQLLGFKLRFYASPTRDTSDVLPENLIYLAALLIKIGFISLRDLYPHLYPPDEAMDPERERLEKEKVEKERSARPGGGMNALAMAGALADDTLPVLRSLRNETARSGASSPRSDKKDDDKDQLPPPANQKILLLKGLLAIGALPEALFILGRFPWLVDADTSLPPYLHRIANHMLSKVADSIRPLPAREELLNTEEQQDDTAPNADGTLKLAPRVKVKPRRHLGLDTPDNGDAPMKHYYNEWDDCIPVCRTLDDVFLLCNTLLGYLGVKVGQDSLLLSRLVRLARHSLSEDLSDSNQSRWLELIKRLLVPALSLTKHNPGLNQEVYELLKLFPITTRYSIYAEWFHGKTSRLPDVRSAFDLNRAEAKDVLRRVTNESGKKQARALAKVTLSSPAIVMETFINQLESYSNMIPSLVECCRFFSPLAWDVLVWCLINSLSGQGRDRIQADGMLTSPWLQALSHFVASLFVRHAIVDPSPVLQYVAAELKAGDSTDLELLEQVLGEMAGIKSDMEFNDAQVLAMTGGEVLQSQIVQQLADVRHQRKSSAKRLMRALSEPGLIGQILISVAQETQMYPHRETAKWMPLKVLGNNLDKIQQVFAQYLEVLKTNMTVAEFEAVVPDVVALIGDFGLEPAIAFAICRTSILHRMLEADEAKLQEQRERKRRSSQGKSQVDGDTEMQDSGVKSSLMTQDSPPAVNGDSQDNAATPQPSATTSGTGDKPWHPILEPILDTLPEVMPDVAERVSIPFLVTFWTLSQRDVLVHTESYDAEMKKLRVQIQDINRDRADQSSVAAKERERKKKALQETIDKLGQEVKIRVAAYTKMKMWLNTQKRHWFSHSAGRAERESRHLGLLQECFLPRATMSSLDAHYCFLILKIMHNNGTPGFSIMDLLQQLMRKQELAAVIFQCTAKEAEHFGRFLCEVLRLLQHWHANKETYEKEGLGSQRQLFGFAKKVNDDGTPDHFMEYEEFRRFVFNHHANLNAALKMCFESGEYMHIRNGIIVLKAVSQVFPALTFMGNHMFEQVKKLSDQESRGDLKLAATSLLGPLKSREKQWVLPQAFRLNDPAKDGARSTSRAPSAKPETPHSSAETPKLNAAAPEFKPSPAALTNGTARKESVTGAMEDGEVEDEKVLATKDGDVKMANAPDTTHTAVKPPDAKLPDKRPTPEPIPAPDSVAKEAPIRESKPKTPAPNAAKPPTGPNGNASRPEAVRAPSMPQSNNISSRPESGPPRKPLPAPPRDRQSGRFGDRGDEHFGRLERPNENRPPSSREHSPGRHSRARTPERDPYYGASAPAPGRGNYRDDRAQRQPLPDSRYGRDDGFSSSRREPMPQPNLHSRPTEARDRFNGTMGPPSTHTHHADRPSAVSSEVSAPVSQQDTRPPSSGLQVSQVAASESGPSVNPGRLALINGDGPIASARGSNAPMIDRDVRRERGSRRDERTTGKAAPPPEPSRDPPARIDHRSDQAPTGPRGDRELLSMAEPSRGRLNRDMPPPVQQQESSYGRLNAPQEVPSGPRAANGPSGRGGRNFTAPSVNTRVNEPPTPLPTSSRPPDSPAAFRAQHQRQPSERRGSGPQLDRQQQASSVPSTPAAESPMGPMHPSRMASFSNAPTPIQTNVAPATGPRNASSPTTAPPSGPRSSFNNPPAGTPTGPSPTNGAPRGPATPAERQRRGDRQRADINAALQGTNLPPSAPGQGVSFRGAAASRNPSFSGPSQSNNILQDTQPQVIASPIEVPSRREAPSTRQDGPTNRPANQVELFQQRANHERRGGSRSRRSEDERGEAPRTSRASSRERRADDQPPQRPPPQGTDDRRDQRAPRDERRERDERPSRGERSGDRPPRDDDVPPTRPPPLMQNALQGPPRDDGYGARGDGRSLRRDGQPDENRRGGRGGGRNDDYRGGGRGDGGREGGRGPQRDDGPQQGGRKRRHEDGPFDESKRRRSGR